MRLSINDFLRHELLMLPKSWQNHENDSFSDYISKTGEHFLDLLDSVDEYEIRGEDRLMGTFSKKSLINLCTNMHNCITKSVSIYLNQGDPHTAYDSFEKGISFGINENKVSCPLMSLESTHIFPENYRLRVIEKEPSIQDMFHVPIQLRHKINSFRYSVAGFPALYLSTNIYTAFKELNEPDYDNLYVSKFYTNSHSNSTINLNILPPIGKRINTQYKFIGRWPLLLATTTKIKHQDGAFRPEYIIPQMLMLFIKRKMISNDNKNFGISYPSSKFAYDRKSHVGSFSNTAILAKDIGEKGYCKILADTFYLTKPISFREALKKIVDVKDYSTAKEIERNGFVVPYAKTDFGKIEEVLKLPKFGKAHKIKV